MIYCVLSVVKIVYDWFFSTETNEAHKNYIIIKYNSWSWNEPYEILCNLIFSIGFITGSKEI